MRLDEIQNITIDGVNSKVHNLVYSILKRLERDYDLDLLKPFHENVKITQNKNNPNLVTITLNAPINYPGRGALYFVDHGEDLPHVADQKKRAAPLRPIAMELESYLKVMVKVEDSTVELTPRGYEVFVVSDDFVG